MNHRFLPARLILWTLVLGAGPATSVTAAELVYESYQLRGSAQEFVLDVPRHLVLSRGCLKPDGAYRCKAFQALRSRALVPAPESANGGENPGAGLCQLVHGHLHAALDRQENEASFCGFEDGSYVGTGTLDFYARNRKYGPP